MKLIKKYQQGEAIKRATVPGDPYEYRYSDGYYMYRDTRTGTKDWLVASPGKQENAIKAVFEYKSPAPAEPTKPKMTAEEVWEYYYILARKSGYGEGNAIKFAQAYTENATKRSSRKVDPSKIDVPKLEKELSGFLQERKSANKVIQSAKDNKQEREQKEMTAAIHAGHSAALNGAFTIYNKALGTMSNALYYPIAASRGKLTDPYGNPKEFSWNDYGNTVFRPGTDDVFGDQVVASPEWREEHPYLSAGVSTVMDPLTLATIMTSGGARTLLARGRNGLANAKNAAYANKNFGGVALESVDDLIARSPGTDAALPKKVKVFTGTSNPGSTAEFHAAGGKRAPQGSHRPTNGTKGPKGNWGSGKVMNQNPAKVSGQGYTPKSQTVHMVYQPWKNAPAIVTPRPVIYGNGPSMIFPIWDRDPILPTPVKETIPVLPETRMEILTPAKPVSQGSVAFQKAFREAAKAGLSEFPFGSKMYKVEYAKPTPAKRYVAKSNPNVQDGEYLGLPAGVVSIVPDSTTSNVGYVSHFSTINTLPGGITGNPNTKQVKLSELE